MDSATVKTRKIGGSIMVRIPKEMAEAGSIEPNELVKISIEKIRKSGFGIARGIGPYSHEKVGDFD